MSKHKERDHYNEEKLKKYKMDKSDNQIFRTLSVGLFSPRLDDESVKAIIYKEFRKFGEYMICVMKNNMGLKFAHTQFRYYEDAMNVRMAYKNKDLDFEPGICVEIVNDEYTREKKVYPPGIKSSPPNIPGKLDYRHKDFQSNLDISGFKNSYRGDKHFQDDADDKNATRTLFIGNLDYDITAEELATIFGRYGIVEDIDIKRSSLQMHASVYAFIRFVNLEMARRAKAEMSGQYIRKFQCRIGYGKHVPSNCLWVGGLGPQTTKDDLEKCFSSFNPLKIEWPYGKLYAYIVFSTLELATSVLNTLQGYEINPGCFIRLDYSDESHISMLMGSSTLIKSQDEKCNIENSFQPNSIVACTLPPNNPVTNPNLITIRPPNKVFDVIPPNLKTLLAEVDNLKALIKHLQMVWEGNLCVKSSIFPIKIHMQCGHAKLIDELLKGLPSLKFNRLLSLDSLKVASVIDFVNSDDSECSLLFISPAEEVKQENPENIKQFKSLLAYMKKKQSIGVSFLPENVPHDKSKGAIHWFGPEVCTKDLVQVLSPKIPDESLLKQDYLLAILSSISVKQCSSNNNP